MKPDHHDSPWEVPTEGWGNWSTAFLWRRAPRAMTVWHKRGRQGCLFLVSPHNMAPPPSCYPLSDCVFRFLIKLISEIPTENHVQDSRHSIHFFCWAPPQWLSIWLKLPYKLVTQRGLFHLTYRVLIPTCLTGFWAHLVRDDGKDMEKLRVCLGKSELSPLELSFHPLVGTEGSRWGWTQNPRWRELHPETLCVSRFKAPDRFALDGDITGFFSHDP